MKKAVMAAMALSSLTLAAAPALAQDRDYRDHRDGHVMRDNGWTPNIVVRHGRHGYWDERHHWRQARFMNHQGHRGYWDHHHHWHDWDG